MPPLPPRSGGAGPFAASWWGEEWVRALEESALDPGRLMRGRMYARAGHVGALTVTPGRITAPVRGSRPRPYRTGLRLPVLSDGEWDAFLGAVAARPAHIEALLAKEMPRELVEAARHAGVRLLPAPGELVPQCSCPDHGAPCKHAAALCHQTARVLDVDPFVLLLLRGREEGELLDGLRSHGTGAVAAAAADGGADGGADSGADAGAHGTTDGGTGGGDSVDGTADSAADSAADSTATGGSAGPSGSSDPGPRLPVVPAREALATTVRPPLPAPLPPPEFPGVPLPLALPLPLPGASGGAAGGGVPDPAALDFLAADAAARAHAGLTGGDPCPHLTPRQDAVRLAATHPRLTGRRTFSPLFTRLAERVGLSVTELARAAAAWRQGGAEGLAVLEAEWDPPAGDFDRARGALAAAGLPRMSIRRNRLTAGGLQLRYGRDGRWYPYRGDPGEGGGSDGWWPGGPSSPDPVDALSGPNRP